jgi:hypothetical protein
VASGVATLSAAVVELFVPQMLNYESTSGVSFKKGCYPGQEVVARSQFRGTLKRRTYRVRSSELLTPGQEIYAGGDLEQPVGVVVQSAPHPGGGAMALLCLQTGADMHHLRTKNQPAVQLDVLELPYPLLDDI